MKEKRGVKLVKEVLDNPKNIDFESIKRLLEFFGYECRQPGKGSSHYVFRKKGTGIITVPKNKPVKAVYVKEIIKILDLRYWYEQNY
ncbi:MAG TPA: type II toxin-antitoxin system HicA family toxin [bacterium]|nr:type II toxin-antitoxin system HicA family toxin [bacterium]